MLGTAFLAMAFPARACQTALLLSVDVSNSIDPSEYQLQIGGIAEALRDPLIVDAMVRGRNSVALMQWSGMEMQALALPWRRIGSPADLEAAASRIEKMPRFFVGGNTAIGEALRASVLQFSTMGDCARWIVDVSGDGAENAGSSVARYRRAAENAGVTVNGLAIEGLGAAITNYYRRMVVTGDGFVETARGFSDFARAIRVKIRREVSGVSG